MKLAKYVPQLERRRKKIARKILQKMPQEIPQEITQKIPDVSNKL